MQKEFLKGLGLEEEAIDKILAEHGRTVSTLTNERDSFEKQVLERDEQLTKLSEANKGNEDLTAQITALQNQITAKDEEAALNLATTKTDYEIQLALQSAGARNFKTVLPLLDREKISLDEKGKLANFEEQLKALQEDKSNAYLFNAEEEPKKPTIMNPGNPNPTTPSPNNAESFFDAWNPK